MNKKGFEPAINTLILIIISITLIIIVSSIFFIGPQALFVKIKSILPSLSTYLPTKTNNENYYNSPTKEQAVATFKRLSDAFRSLKKEQAKNCFYFFNHDELATTMKEYLIEIKKNEKTNNMELLLRRWNKKNNPRENALSIATSTEKIEGVKPCIVYGKLQTRKFYEEWLNPHADFSNTDLNYQNYQDSEDYSEVNNLKLYEKKIIINNDFDNGLLFITANNGDYVLYKADENHVCLIPTADYTNTCGYRLHKGLLDAGCFGPDDMTSAGEYTIKKMAKLKKFNVYQSGKGCAPIS